MEMSNTVLDDIAGVIGFTPTLRLAAWFGGGSSVYVPLEVAEGQVLSRLIGLSAARALSAEFGGEVISLPGISGYDLDLRRRLVKMHIEGGASTREVSVILRVSERRVCQIVQELELVGLLEPQTRRKNDEQKAGVENLGKNPASEPACEIPKGNSAGKIPGEKAWVKVRGKKCGEKSGAKAPGKSPEVNASGLVMEALCEGLIS